MNNLKEKITKNLLLVTLYLRNNHSLIWLFEVRLISDYSVPNLCLIMTEMFKGFYMAFDQSH